MYDCHVFILVQAIKQGGETREKWGEPAVCHPIQLLPVSPGGPHEP